MNSPCVVNDVLICLGGMLTARVLPVTPRSQFTLQAPVSQPAAQLEVSLGTRRQPEAIFK